MRKQFTVSATQIGCDEAVSIENIFGMLQDAVTMTLGEMGCDNITLRRDYHSMWVFSRHRVRVFRRPTWGETVNVFCRVVKNKRVACWMATDLTDSSGNLLIQGLLECCVLDRETFGFVKLTEIPFTPSMEEAEPFRPDFQEPMEHISDFRVVPSLTDLSGHMNNAKGLRPLEDSFTKEQLMELYALPFEVNIRYLSQAMLGSSLQLWRGTDLNHFSFVYRAEGGKDIFSGCIERLAERGI